MTKQRTHADRICTVGQGLEYCGSGCRQGIVIPHGDPCPCGHAQCVATLEERAK